MTKAITGEQLRYYADDLRWAVALLALERLPVHLDEQGVIDRRSEAFFNCPQIDVVAVARKRDRASSCLSCIDITSAVSGGAQPRSLHITHWTSQPLQEVVLEPAEASSQRQARNHRTEPNEGPSHKTSGCATSEQRGEKQPEMTRLSNCARCGSLVASVAF
jgi:hypothetical protein